MFKSATVSGQHITVEFVAGTANATVGAMNRRQANKQAQAQQQYAQPAPAPAPQPAPAPAAPAAGDDVLDKLTQLTELKNAGVLTDEEFAAAKAKLLA